MFQFQEIPFLWDDVCYGRGYTFFRYGKRSVECKVHPELDRVIFWVLFDCDSFVYFLLDRKEAGL